MKVELGFAGFFFITLSVAFVVRLVRGENTEYLGPLAFGYLLLIELIWKHRND